MTRDEVFNMIYPFGQPTELTQSQVYGMIDKLTSKGLLQLTDQVETPEDEALGFIMGDFEFLHAGHMDRMARVKRFMDMVGMKMVRK
mgnify:CR=1 FL=1